MFGGEAEPDEGDVGVLLRCDRANLRDFNLASDHFIPESGDNLSEQCEPIVPLVCD
jgi:hypothetical protein